MGYFETQFYYKTQRNGSVAITFAYLVVHLHLPSGFLVAEAMPSDLSAGAASEKQRREICFLRQ